MITAIVLDIEGTTSSLSYVHDRFFPYSRDRVATWVRRPGDEIAGIVTEVRRLIRRPAASLDEVAAALCQWIDQDVKAAPLKTLQGLIWQAGFESGDLVSHVYDDVPPTLRRWRSAGVQLSVFSSGSLLAQRLWFRHTQHGDLAGLFSAHFDTRNAGPKQEAESYLRIGREIGAAPQQTLFLSDTVGELDAAREAGWHTTHVIRPDAARAPATDHARISALDELRLDAVDTTRA